MRISEIYRSRQGEGLLTGTDSVFIRSSGCNLRCWFCDTPYTSWQPEGEDQSVAEIVAEALALEASHVVITGGEPLLFSEMIPLCEQLTSAGKHITIETAGTLFLPVACDLMSISPKLASSTPSEQKAGAWSARHERSRHVPRVITKLTQQYAYQLKFVVDVPEDLVEVENYLNEFPHLQRERVMLMPQGISREDLAEREAWLRPYCETHGLTFCPRMHIAWYGAKRGT